MSPFAATIEPQISTEAAPLLQTRGLSVHFDDRSALEDVTFQVAPGERVSLVGPNGAGKSTLLKTIAGILAPSHGDVLIDAQPASEQRYRVVYIPQRTGIDWSFPLSVIDVVLMARREICSRLGPYGVEDRTAALAALRDVGMAVQANVQIGKLSGGQQQRMFLARALLQPGDLYLLDEPFTGVDQPTQQLVTSLFSELAGRGKSIIFATHDLDQAEHSADRILMLNRRLIASGEPASVMTADAMRRTFGDVERLHAGGSGEI